MGRPYSADLRDRVRRHIEAGHSRREASRHFGVSASFAVKLARRVAVSGSTAPARQGRPPGDGKLQARIDKIIAWVEAEPDITMPELAAKLLACGPTRRRCRGCCRRRASPSKKTLMASECGRDDVRQDRRVWRGSRQPRMRREPHRLVFVDETAPTTKLTRLRGRARRHQRLKARALRGH